MTAKLSEIHTARSVSRDPDKTRSLILDAAFQAIHRQGYQGMRLDDVVAATGLTKGALYHHFPNKQALGYAVVDEVIRGIIEQVWLQPLEASTDPLAEIIYFVGHMDALFGARIVTFGCPVNNLAQEMSPLDEGFRTRLDKLYQEWRTGIQHAIERARASGAVRSEIDAQKVASFVIAALAGCIGIAKNAQSLEQLKTCADGLIGYLESLRT
ncbi:MAG: TetR/AcrR family transcriptional regulator [Thiohalobacteraceae bacterium]